MSRVSSPAGRRRVRHQIGRSNRRQVLNPMDGTFELRRSIPTPGLDGTMFDGDLRSFLNASTIAGADPDSGNNFPSIPVRASTAMSMTNTIGHATASSIREQEVSLQWGKAQGRLFEDTLGPDGDPRRSVSVASQRAGRATPWRRTNVTSVSVTLSADPENTRTRLTFATRSQRLHNPPTATDLLATLSHQKSKSGGVNRPPKGRVTQPVTGLSGVTPGPMVFDDPQHVDCPTQPSKTVTPAIAQQLNAANDGHRATSSSSTGVCANGAWVMRKGTTQHSPARGGDGDAGQGSKRVSLRLSPLRHHENPTDVLQKVPHTTYPAQLRGDRTRYGGTEHLTQAPVAAAGCSYQSPADRFNTANRGLGASLDAQESKLRVLVAQQRRVLKKAESGRQLEGQALAAEQRNVEKQRHGFQVRTALRQVREQASKTPNFKVTPPNAFQALMDP